MRYTFLIFSLILLISLSSCGQTAKHIRKGTYTVDSNIKSKVDQKVKSLDGFTFNSMDFKMYDDDSVVFDTYVDGKSFDQCMTITSLDGDTININGFIGMTAAFGYQIALFKNNCIVKHFVKSDVRIYRLNRTDSLDFGVFVPCEKYKLTLTKKPTFKKGEIVEGIIELTSNEYYELVDGKEKRHKTQLTGYFRTDPPLVWDEDKYKKMTEEHK